MDKIHTSQAYLGMSDWIAIAAAVLAAVSIFVSVITFYIQRRSNYDKELLSYLCLSLERMFTVLAPAGETEEPIRDRVAWLTAARHICAYLELKAKLKTSLYKTLCDEQEEHWRHKTYLVISRISSSQFFSWVNANKFSEENIDPTSAAVVLAYSSWPPDKRDKIDEISLAGLVSDADLFSAKHRHFRDYVAEQFPHIFADITKQA